MHVYRTSDLQRRLGDVQVSADQEPVLFETRGRFRSVLMSVREFIRLKEKAEEPLPAPLHRPVVQRGLPSDPLGYDTTDFAACARAMAEAALSGRNASQVRVEIAAVEQRLGIRCNGET